MTVEIFTLENCVQCEQTKKQFDRAGVRYEEKTLTADLADEFKAEGFAAAPIVKTEIETWSGFRLTKIKDTAHAIFTSPKI